MKATDHMQLLGMKVRDRVTGVTGVVTSVCFDLYGCIQAIVNRGFDKEGKALESQWFDVVRLEAIEPEPVMDPPDFGQAQLAEGRKGPEAKPLWK